MTLGHLSHYKIFLLQLFSGSPAVMMTPTRLKWSEGKKEGKKGTNCTYSVCLMNVVPFCLQSVAYFEFSVWYGCSQKRCKNYKAGSCP